LSATGAVAREPVRSSGCMEGSHRRHSNEAVIWKAATGATCMRRPMTSRSCWWRVCSMWSVAELRRRSSSHRRGRSRARHFYLEGCHRRHLSAYIHGSSHLRWIIRMTKPHGGAVYLATNCPCNRLGGGKSRIQAQVTRRASGAVPPQQASLCCCHDAQRDPASQPARGGAAPCSSR